MAQAKLNLEFTHVTAPVDGRIGSHQVSLGNLIVGGSAGALTLLTTIVSLDPIYFNFDMSESDYLSYQRATRAGLMTSARDGMRCPRSSGWSTRRAGRTRATWTSSTTRSTGVPAPSARAAIFANAGLILTPGEFGRIRVPGSEPHQAILIPDAAIVTDQSRKIVMTVSADGTVEPRVIRPGPTYEGLRIVRGGLATGDTHRHQRSGARPARCEGDASAGQDRSRARAVSSRPAVP